MSSRSTFERCIGLWTRLGPVGRAAAYSAAVVLLLGAATYRWVWSDPAQVARRVEAAVGEFTSARVEASGDCSAAWRQGTRIEALSFRSPNDPSAAPRVEIRGLEIDDPSLPPGLAPGRELRSLIDGEIEPACRLVAHDVLVRGQARETIERLLDLDALAGHLGRHAIDMAAGRVAITPGGDAPVDGDGTWVLRGGRLRTDGTGALLAEVDLAPSSAWDHGYAELYLDLEAGDVDARIAFENPSRTPPWLDGLVPEVGAAWSALEIEGRSDIRLSLRRPGRAARYSWSIEARHFDTRFRVPAAIPGPIERYRGGMVIDESGVVFGDGPDGRAPTGELAGVPCRVSGRTGAGSDDRVELEFARERVGAWVGSGASPSVRAILGGSWLRGRVGASLVAGAEEWELALVTAPLEVAGPAGLGCREATTTRPLAGDARRGGGRLEFREVAWSGIAEGTTFRFTVDVDWDPDAVEVRMAGEPESRAAGGAAERARGGAESEAFDEAPTRATPITASWRVDRASGAVEGRGAWADLPWSSPGLRAMSTRGEFRVGAAGGGQRATTDAAAAGAAIDDVGAPRGTVDLGPGVLFGGEVDGADLEFDWGRIEWVWRRDGGLVELASIHLRGPRGVVRGHGRLGAGGQIDALFLRVEGERATALDAAGTRVGPQGWVRAVDGRDASTWRLVGPLDGPQPESIDIHTFVYLFDPRA